VEKGRGPNLGGDIVINAALFTCRVTPTYAIASVLKLNLLILSTTITSFTAVVDDNYLNLWLNWKFEAKKLKLSGYSRRGYNGWEFAQQATDIIKEYITKFIQRLWRFGEAKMEIAIQTWIFVTNGRAGRSLMKSRISLRVFRAEASRRWHWRLSSLRAAMSVRD